MGSEVESAALRTRLAALRALADAATPGEWDIFTIASPAGTSSRIFQVGTDKDLAHIPMDWNGDGENARFIAAARTALPELAGLLEKALDVVDEVRDGLSDEGFLDARCLREQLAAFDAAAEKLNGEAHGA